MKVEPVTDVEEALSHIDPAGLEDLVERIREKEDYLDGSYVWTMDPLERDVAVLGPLRLYDTQGPDVLAQQGAPMSRERYAAEALVLIATIDADVEAAGRTMAAGGLTTHEAANNVAATMHRAFASFPRPEDPNVAPEPRYLQDE